MIIFFELQNGAAASATGIQDADEGAPANTFAEAADVNDVDEISYPESIRRTSSVSNGTAGRDTIVDGLASLIEVLRTTVSCECVYVRVIVIEALIRMQGPIDSFEELESIITTL